MKHPAICLGSKLKLSCNKSMCSKRASIKQKYCGQCAVSLLLICVYVNC